MTANPYSVQPVEGQKQSIRRGVAFLSCGENNDLNAASTFIRLKPNRAREVRTRFDHWIDGNQPRDNWFHGWPGHPKYKHCFVFKWKENRQHHRLYGFLYNPQPTSRPGFQLCVLATHAKKNERETDERELDIAVSLRANRAVIAAIQSIYPDVKGGTEQWVN